MTGIFILSSQTNTDDKMGLSMEGSQYHTGTLVSFCGDGHCRTCEHWLVHKLLRHCSRKEIALKHFLALFHRALLSEKGSVNASGNPPKYTGCITMQCPDGPFS